MAVEETGRDEATDILHVERAETVAHAVALDLEQRLQPHHAARTRAHDLDRATGSGCGTRQRRGDLIGTDRDRGGIARNVEAHGHAPASLSSASRRSAVMRPTTRPSIIADGAVAHRPRQ